MRQERDTGRSSRAEPTRRIRARGPGGRAAIDPDLKPRPIVVEDGAASDGDGELDRSNRTLPAVLERRRAGDHVSGGDAVRVRVEPERARHRDVEGAGGPGLR